MLLRLLAAPQALCRQWGCQAASPPQPPAQPAWRPPAGAAPAHPAGRQGQQHCGSLSIEQHSTTSAAQVSARPASSSSSSRHLTSAASSASMALRSAPPSPPPPPAPSPAQRSTLCATFRSSCSCPSSARRGARRPVYEPSACGGSSPGQHALGGVTELLHYALLAQHRQLLQPPEPALQQAPHPPNGQPKPAATHPPDCSAPAGPHLWHRRAAC